MSLDAFYWVRSKLDSLCAITGRCTDLLSTSRSPDRLRGTSCVLSIGYEKAIREVVKKADQGIWEFNSITQIESPEEYKPISLYIFILYCLIRSQKDSNCTFICLLIICAQKNNFFLGGGGGGDIHVVYFQWLIAV